MKCKLLLCAGLLLLGHLLPAQQTVGLFLHENSSEDSGYVLFSPMGSTTTYLIDKCGKLVHNWNSSYNPGLSVYLLEDGSILRTGQDINSNFLGGGIVEKIDWDGTILFRYLLSDNEECQHHDIEPMPNGNFLVIMYERIELGEAIQAGRNPNFIDTELWPDKIIEIEPIDFDNYNVVWEWHSWDHLVQRYDSTKANYGQPKDHPELINLNYFRNKNSDMFHFNSVDYNPLLDQILISVHTFNEIWIIDHSTTIAEAASHSGGKSGKGGDLLYRWGNPEAYNNGTADDKKLFGQHDAQWICSGNRYMGCISLFNNGRLRPDSNYSSVEIIVSPVCSTGAYYSSIPYLPLSQCWIYKDSSPGNFYSQNISGAQQLDGGNVLICEGQTGKFFEVDTLGNKVWEYVNPASANGIIEQNNPAEANKVFKCSYYPMSYPAFEGRELEGTDPIELNPIPYVCELNIPNSISEASTNYGSTIYSNNGVIFIQPPFENYTVQLINMNGQIVFSSNNAKEINASNLKKGVFLMKIQCSSGKVLFKKVFI